MRKLVILILASVMLFACGSKGQAISFDSENIISNEELITYIKNPSSADKGKSVKFGAKVSNDVGIEKDKHYYQLTLDPKNYDLDLIIDISEDQELNVDEYVIVEGVIGGEFKGENMLGGLVTNLFVSSTTVKKSSFIDAIAPAKETININQSLEQNGVEITVNKLEISDIDSRLYVEIVNNSSSTISIYSFNVKIVANGKNYSEEYSFTEDYPEIDSELAPNTNTSGIITYVPLDVESLSDFTIIFDRPYANDWNIDFEDYIFSIKK